MLPHRALIVAAVVAGCGRPAEPAPPAAPRGEPLAARVHGSAGCSALACHGGLDTREPGWPNAATVWHQADPHAGAGRTLYGSAAEAIRCRLGEPRPAFETARCLACHVTPELAAADDAYAAARRPEGVGCEACHTRPGASTGAWLDAHTLGRVAAGYAADRGGLNWLNDARGRAAVCVGCHVGAPADGPVPLRDVTHDLIAAGHPRLNFDYGTYLAALPAHWRERARTVDGGEAPRPPGVHAAAWADGRFETARAAAVLLADRAARAELGGAWPEFAAFDCYSCHHTLRTTAPRRAAGRMVWNRAELPRFLVGSPPIAGLDELAETLAGRRPAPAAVRAAADRLAERFATAERPADLRVSVERTPSDADWDDQARAYYALAAVARDRHPGARPSEKQTTAAAALRFPRTPPANSPVGHHPAAAAAALADWAAALR